MTESSNNAAAVDNRPPWISGRDAADLFAVALLEPQTYAGSPIVYGL